MTKSNGSTRRDRNREAVRKFREKTRREEDEMQSLYRSNEEKIARLESMADRLAAELSSSKRRWSGNSDIHEQLLTAWSRFNQTWVIFFNIIYNYDN